MAARNSFQKAVKKAIKDEVEAVAFYKLAARTTEDKSAMKVFEKLALDEMEHLNALVETFGGTNFSSKEIDEMETNNTRLLKKKVDRSTQAREAIVIALREEEDAAVAYTSLYKSEHDPKQKRLFKELVGIEKDHAKILQAELDRIDK